MLKKIIFLTSVLIASSVNAKENSRPKSIGGEYLIEVNSGVVFEDSEDVFEIGIDFEKFLDGTNHHFSLGIATEVDFKDHKNDYYFGPLFSFYYLHTKTFFSTGILTDFEGNSEWKSRLGLGYELVLANHLLAIPYIAIDYVNNETNPTTGIGIAYEF